MPVHINSIGSFTFFDLVGTVFVSQQQVEVLERMGVNGLGFRKCGTKGKPFEMVSITYHDDFETAADALDSYALAVGSVVTITRNDIAAAAFVILEVAEARPPYAVLNVAGSPGSECRAEVKWKLVQY